MAKSAVAVKTHSADPEPKRRIPVIKPDAVELNHGGHLYQSWFVRLPDGFISDDLKETEVVWKAVQNSVHSFRKFDHLFMISFDESWGATAVVIEAGMREVQLGGMRIINFDKRTKPLFEDDEHRVVWLGNGYAVERKKDGQRVTQLVGDEILAERDLRGLYPRPLS